MWVCLYVQKIVCQKGQPVEIAPSIRELSVYLSSIASPLVERGRIHHADRDRRRDRFAARGVESLLLVAGQR